MATNAKYPMRERAKDYSIKAISFVFGSLHFAGRLTADAAREGEAQLIHLVDKGCEKDKIRARRDHQYDAKMADIKMRIEESKRVMEETYQNITNKMNGQDMAIANLVLTNESIAPAPPAES